MPYLLWSLNARPFRCCCSAVTAALVFRWPDCVEYVFLNRLRRKGVVLPARERIDDSSDAKKLMSLTADGEGSFA